MGVGHIAHCAGEHRAEYNERCAPEVVYCEDNSAGITGREWRRYFAGIGRAVRAGVVLDFGGFRGNKGVGG